MGRLKRIFRKEQNPAGEPVDAAGALQVEGTRPCPHCGQQVSRGATVCLYCERDLVPLMSPDRLVSLFGEVRRSESNPHGDGEESPE